MPSALISKPPAGTYYGRRQNKKEKESTPRIGRAAGREGRTRFSKKILPGAWAVSSFGKKPFSRGEKRALKRRAGKNRQVFLTSYNNCRVETLSKNRKPSIGAER